MANENNLKPIRTESEAREKGKKGGIKSGEIRRKRKELREELAIMLNTEVDGETYQEKITLALINKALNGDVKAYMAIADMLRESPKTNDFLETTLTDVFRIIQQYENEEE